MREGQDRGRTVDWPCDLFSTSDSRSPLTLWRWLARQRTKSPPRQLDKTLPRHGAYCAAHTLTNTHAVKHRWGSSMQAQKNNNNKIHKGWGPNKDQKRLQMLMIRERGEQTMCLIHRDLWNRMFAKYVYSRYSSETCPNPNSLFFGKRIKTLYFWHDWLLCC